MRTMEDLAMHLLQEQPDVPSALVRGVTVFMRNKSDLPVDFDGSAFSFSYELYKELVKHGRVPGRSVFFTPIRIGKRLCQEAKIIPGNLVLDPCAGLGCLLLAALGLKAKVYGFEISPWLVTVSRMCRPDLHVIGKNFLRDPDGVKSYVMPDIVLLNPPVGSQQGCVNVAGRMIERIQHLYKNARLIALLPIDYFTKMGRRKRTRSIAVNTEIAKMVELPDSGRIEEFLPWTRSRFAIFELKSQL